MSGAIIFLINILLVDYFKRRGEVYYFYSIAIKALMLVALGGGYKMYISAVRSVCMLIEVSAMTWYSNAYAKISAQFSPRMKPKKDQVLASVT